MRVSYATRPWSPATPWGGFSTLPGKVSRKGAKTQRVSVLARTLADQQRPINIGKARTAGGPHRRDEFLVQKSHDGFYPRFAVRRQCPGIRPADEDCSGTQGKGFENVC